MDIKRGVLKSLMREWDNEKKIGASQIVTEEFHKKMMGYVSEN